ncbi:MAG TPA: AMP-binding protein [Acidimicrobiales bacterium]|nr:AMP-binding protein [Acidimicrobiales bacterium]
MTTVAELLVARAGDDHTGLRFEDESWSWRQVVAECAARARMLTALRREGPFHVGVLLENVPEYLFLLGGAALAGATVVGINPTRRGQELARDIRHTACQLIVTDAAQLPLLDGLDTGVEPGRVLLCDAAAYPLPAGAPALGEVPSELPGPDVLYLLLFTSGSTGAPKAVRVSQGRMASQASVMAAGSGFGPDDVMYCAMPMFHGNALNTCVVPAIAAGAVLVLRRRFSASGFLPDVRRYGVTYFNYVGRALAYVLATPPAPDDADNTLRFGFGTDGSPQDISSFRRRFACPVVEGYGSSEGAISMSRVPGTPRQAMGKPPPGTDVVIVDPSTGHECPRARFDTEGMLRNASDAIGEIVSRDGAARFEGYYANAEADAERTREGWFWSGDLGYRDEDGFFYFAGRTADWLRVDGENFAAAPVERILARFPGVVTAVVLPVPDPRTGDQVMAALEMTDPAAFDPAAFGEFLAHQADLGTKWAPRFVRITDHVPLTGTGKVDKRPLRHQYWKTSDPLWWRPPAPRGGDTPAYRLLTPADVAALQDEFEAHGRVALLDV